MCPAGSHDKTKLEKRRQTNMLTSIVLVLPLLLFYEMGVLLTDVMNGADLITQNLIRWLGVQGFVWVQIGLAALLVAMAIYLRKHETLDLKKVAPVFLESGIYALSMGTLIVFVMVDILHINPELAAQLPGQTRGIFERLVISAGAGVHEEFIFRLVLMSGLLVGGTKLLGMRRWAALVWAILISSVLFSAAHHVGPLGDPLRIGVFVYRTIAGILFALLFQFRSFAIAVYTHTFYDIYVLLLT